MVKKRQRGGAAGGVDGGEGDAGHASSRSSKRVRFPEELAEEKEVTGNGPATGIQYDDEDEDEDDLRGLRGRRGADDDDDDDEDDDGVAPGRMTDKVDGEEDDGEEKFNEVGEIIEPFNLKGERDEGFFDTTGNFVWRKQREEPDAWIANMDEAAMEDAIGQAAAAHRDKLKAQAQEGDNPLATLSVDELRPRVVELLQPKETVLKALRRLGKCKDFDQLTELADQMLQAGDMNIYQTIREDIEAQVQQRKVHERQKEGLPIFEYRGKDGKVHGPYRVEQMRDWIRAGYFSGENVVMMRRIGPLEDKCSGTGGGEEKKAPVESAPTPTTDVDDLMADLDDDDDDDSGESEKKDAVTAPVPTGKQGADTGAIPLNQWVPSDSVTL